MVLRYALLLASCLVSVSALSQEKSPDLYGGRPIKAGELPISVYIGNCTASIVGPEVIMTAGHCRATGSAISFSLNQVRYTGKCVRDPKYNQGGYTNNDWALCKFAPKIELPVYASLSSKTLKVGDAVTMQGYGAGSNGKLNVGESVVRTVNNQDYTTRGTVYLGGGDSGGGLFEKVPDLIKGPFRIVGVNSRAGGNTSYFNITGLERSQAFFKSYVASEKVDVCGVNKDCELPTDPTKCVEEKQDVEAARLELVSKEDLLKACLAE